jgi:HSP20 family protein
MQKNGWNMALSLLGRHGVNSILDPGTIAFEADIWDPIEGISMLDYQRIPRQQQQVQLQLQLPQDASQLPEVADTPTDWRETLEAHIFKADLPGVKKEDVYVSIVDGRTLEISGQRIRFDEEEQQMNDTWHHAERPHGSFVRRFQLPVNSIADEGAVTAHVQDGVLTVTIPKPPQPKPKIRHIQVA